MNNLLKAQWAPWLEARWTVGKNQIVITPENSRTHKCVIRHASTPVDRTPGDRWVFECGSRAVSAMTLEELLTKAALNIVPFQAALALSNRQWPDHGLFIGDTLIVPCGSHAHELLYLGLEHRIPFHTANYACRVEVDPSEISSLPLQYRDTLTHEPYKFSKYLFGPEPAASEPGALELDGQMAPRWL